MPATFDDVRDRARDDPVFFASLVLNPDETLAKSGLQVTNPKEVKKLEFLVRSGQENLKSAARLVDIELGTAAWGIGCTCCNGRLLLPGDPGVKLPPLRPRPRMDEPIGPS